MGCIKDTPIYWYTKTYQSYRLTTSQKISGACLVHQYNKIVTNQQLPINEDIEH